MKVFVTGGTGFIGSYIVQDLLKHGHDITIFARNVNKVSGFVNHPHIRFVQGTMEDRDAIHMGVRDQDAVIHVALAWGNTAVDMLLHETALSVYLFQAAAEAGVKNIIYTSSIACFGSAPNSDLGYTKPTDYYGATKAATESYLMAVASKFGIRGNVVRPGYTFGNPCVEGGFIYSDLKLKDMVKAARKNEPIKFVKNDGTQFIWAGDLAQIYTAILHSDLNRRYFTGVSAEFRTWAQVCERIVRFLGSKSEIVLEDQGRPDVKGLPIDVSQIKEAFDFEFKTDYHMEDHIQYLCSLKLD
jgi:UDP-glucose 4-epimerase